MKNYYHILGLSNFASLNDIRRAYRKMALVHHPDRGGDAEIMKEINFSYEFLMKHKDTYDARLRPQRVQPRMQGFTIIVGGGDWTSNTTGSFTFNF